MNTFCQPPSGRPGPDPSECRPITGFTPRSLLLSASLVCSLWLALPQAEAAVVQPGDAVITGFSGIRASDRPIPRGNPLDRFFIDSEGPAAQVLILPAQQAVDGQLLTPTIRHQIKASQVGQVFAITIEPGQDGSAAQIFLGATAAYGLQLVGTDRDGDGQPDRLRRGQADAQWMAGQFGPGGTAGTVWRVDGESGQATPFAQLPDNQAAGIGDIVFDASRRLFYVSDLENGEIHRISYDGQLLDRFDHGLTGRPVRGLPAVADDGRVADIRNPAFDTENPATWGFTQPERQVQGLALQGERLYYAVNGREVWSVGLNSDGGFGPDARWELELADGTGSISDLLFDSQGQLYLAQRGAQLGSYDYARFAEPGHSAVLRYRLEQPDDPATPSRWVAEPEEYAIGQQPDFLNANGGITIASNGAEALLWSTGEKLRASEEGEAGLPADVHGLQGNGLELVRPANEPPQQAVFVDYDNLFNDPEKAGHLGDVEILPGMPSDYVEAPWPVLPPDDYIPEEPWFDYSLNLRLTKRAMGRTCQDGGDSWVCRFEVRVRNTSDLDPFFGRIRVHDLLPQLPAGSHIDVLEDPAPWLCGWIAAPNNFRCERHAFLPPHGSVSFHAIVRIPKAAAEAMRLCHLENVANIAWPRLNWRNSDSFDDQDSASARIPAPYCEPQGQQTNLSIEKSVLEGCEMTLNGIACAFDIRIQNTGPGEFNSTLAVQELIPAAVAPIFLHEWTCTPASLCTHNSNPLRLAPGESVQLIVGMFVPPEVARANRCRIRNEVQIVTPPGGHAMNSNPADDHASAESLINIPNLCADVMPIQQQQCPPGYRLQHNDCLPIHRTPPPSVRDPKCPQGMMGTPPNCYRPPEYCPPGTTGTPPYCRQIPEPRCPEGMKGTPPHCYRVISDPVPCPKGMLGTPPNCYRAPDACPPGTTGKYPNCRKIPDPQCPKGMKGTPPHCYIVDPAPCPKGMVGTPPNCRWVTAPCPKGTVGTPPNCRRISEPCPKGMVGTPPNCRWDTEPRCPQGTIRKNGQCIQLPRFDLPRVTPQFTPQFTPPLTRHTRPAPSELKLKTPY